MFSIDCHKTKKPKLLLRPITIDTNNTMNQSELEVNTCNLRQARETACQQVTWSQLVSVLLLIGSENYATVFV